MRGEDENGDKESLEVYLRREIRKELRKLRMLEV
jgi:hypothetical protein